MLAREDAIFQEVEKMAEAIIHFESSHTCLPAQTASDHETMQMLNRCADVTVKLQLFIDEMSQLSDILPHIKVNMYMYVYIYNYNVHCD